VDPARAQPLLRDPRAVGQRSPVPRFAGGRAGEAVTRELLRHGHQVTVLTRGRVDGVGVPAGAGIVQADLADRASLTRAVRAGPFDGVCHLAALTRVRDSFDHPVDYFDVNAGGTAHLLAALDDARRAGDPPRFVLASTGAVYGSRDGQLREDDPTAPGNPYGASKLAAEQLVGYQAATGALAAVTLRCFSVAGAVDRVGDADTTRIIPRALAVAAGDEPQVKVNGDGSAVREFVHLGDAATAYRLALGAAAPGQHRVFNVGSGHGVTVADVVDAVRRVTGRPVPIEHLPPQPEPHVLMADNGRIRAELGWQPHRSDLDTIVRDGWDARQPAPRPQ
jgi:UDP-glucose 4-epimerase